MSENFIIHIEKLSIAYGNNLILSDISADIPKDKITVILGTSGCGKTTLLKGILRLIPAKAKSLTILNEEILTLDEKDYNKLLKQTGILFQNGALLNSISIYDNVSIPLEQHTKLNLGLIREIAAAKLSLVGLEDAGFKLPSELSGGMKKRAGLARAMALDPKILFCDEPGAGLDPVTALKLDELILRL
ncbi:MAG: ATP-binding cassette domain-containing protein, partial [Candidatus Marinimicrobia bacterium]|nr:ATP-binding cassette domain-containing protein [Candidatus Neomarinimicrobiota bacterium]